MVGFMAKNKKWNCRPDVPRYLAYDIVSLPRVTSRVSPS